MSDSLVLTILVEVRVPDEYPEFARGLLEKLLAPDPNILGFEVIRPEPPRGRPHPINGLMGF